MEKIDFWCHLSQQGTLLNVGGPATARDGWIEEFLEIELPPHAVAALTVEFAPS
jgi:hypothetical protein